MLLRFSIFAILTCVLTGCPGSKSPDTKAVPSAEPAKAGAGPAQPAASAKPAAKEDEDKGGW